MDIQLLKKAIEEEDYQGAKNMLESFFISEITEAQMGKTLFDITMLHVNMENTFNRMQLDFLRAVEEDIKKLRKESAASLDIVDKVKHRRDIANS